MLNIRCVSEKLGDNQVLDQVNLELKAGSVFEPARARCCG